MSRVGVLCDAQVNNETLIRLLVAFSLVLELFIYLCFFISLPFRVLGGECVLLVCLFVCLLVLLAGVFARAGLGW